MFSQNDAEKQTDRCLPFYLGTLLFSLIFQRRNSKFFIVSRAYNFNNQFKNPKRIMENFTLSSKISFSSDPVALTLCTGQDLMSRFKEFKNNNNVPTTVQ